MDNSPWPILSGMVIASSAVSLVCLLHFKSSFFLLVNLLMLVIILNFWWSDVISESTYMGFHSTNVMSNIKTSMIWFIASEIMFFFSFFWAIFHSSVSSSTDIFMVWPPIGISVLNPVSVPLLNTVILLSSSFSVTWSHYSVLTGMLNDSVKSLILTISLSLFFTFLQFIEYLDSPFSVNTSVYSSCFFMATGFHSFHVMVSSTFLIVCLVRMLMGQVLKETHVSYECAIWYWHFVDVVWIMLYISLYWWSSY